jgi:hypothetical protein
VSPFNQFTIETEAKEHRGVGLHQLHPDQHSNLEQSVSLPQISVYAVPGLASCNKVHQNWECQTPLPSGFWSSEV